MRRPPDARCVATGDPPFFVNSSKIKARCSPDHATVYTANGTYTAVRPPHPKLSPSQFGEFFLRHPVYNSQWPDLPSFLTFPVMSFPLLSCHQTDASSSVKGTHNFYRTEHILIKQTPCKAEKRTSPGKMTPLFKMSF